MSSRSPICAMCLSASSRARPRPTSLTRCYPGLGRPHSPRPPSRADARGAVATLTNPERADLFSRSGLTGQIDLPEHAAAAFREELQTGATKLNVKVGHFMVATIFGTRPPDGVTPIGDERVRGRLGEPPPLSAADYPARDLALPSLHPELPRRGGSARRAWARTLLRNGAALGASKFGPVIARRLRRRRPPPSN